jgi:hypothetical protein
MLNPPRQPPPDPIAPEMPAQPQPAEGQRFFQEVVVSRLSRYHLLGSDLRQNVQYVFVSRFTIEKRLPDGGLKVRQKVEAVRLGNADAALQAQLNALLQQMRGATFTLTLNARRQVTALEGSEEAIQVFGKANPLGGQTFLLWSFLDRDGWKELAELSFFRPEKPLRAGEKWSRPLSHSWGPLGRWVGQAGYVDTGPRDGLERFAYQLDLKYLPAAPGAGELPFQIDRADFRPRVARGNIAFDARKERVAAAEEQFHVEGLLAITCLGTSVVVAMDEQQLFRLRLLDHNPLTK